MGSARGRTAVFTVSILARKGQVCRVVATCRAVLSDCGESAGGVREEFGRDFPGAARVVPPAGPDVHAEVRHAGGRRSDPSGADPAGADAPGLSGKAGRVQGGAAAEWTAGGQV